MTEKFQIFLLLAVIPVLIFVWVRIRINEITKIDPHILEYLKTVTPQPMQETEKADIKKNYIAPLVFGFISIWLFSEILNICIERICFSNGSNTRESVIIYSQITLVISLCGFVLGFIVPLLWSLWDKKRIQRKTNLVKLPAYVHSTSNLSTSYGNRTAYLIYFDRYKEKIRAKTVQIKRFESENGSLYKGEFVLIAAEDKKTKIRFVNIFKKIA